MKSLRNRERWSFRNKFILSKTRDLPDSDEHKRNRRIVLETSSDVQWASSCPSSTRPGRWTSSTTSSGGRSPSGSGCRRLRSTFMWKFLQRLQCKTLLVSWTLEAKFRSSQFLRCYQKIDILIDFLVTESLWVSFFFDPFHSGVTRENRCLVTWVHDDIRQRRSQRRHRSHRSSASLIDPEW